MTHSIRIRIGAAYDDVTFTGPQGSVTMDRAGVRAIPDHAKRVEGLRAITHHVIEETEVLHDKDRRRFRRAQAEKARERRAERRAQSAEA